MTPLAPSGQRTPPVQSVIRALAVLEHIAEAGSPVSVTELARELDLNIPAVFRLVLSLELRGFVQRNEGTNRLTLGPRLLELASTAFTKIDLYSLAQPELQELVRRCNESAYLAVSQGGEAVVLGAVPSSHTLRPHITVWPRDRNHCTATGKVILASLEPQALESYLRLASFSQGTGKSIRSRGRLLKEIERVRRQGYALDIDENEIGLSCIAAPVRTSFGRIVGSVALSLPTARFNEERREELISEVRQTAENVSRKLRTLSPVHAATLIADGAARPT